MAATGVTANDGPTCRRTTCFAIGAIPGGADARISTAEWNQLAPEQEARNYRLEPVAPGIWRLRLGQPEQLTPEHFREEAPRSNELAKWCRSR